MSNKVKRNYMSRRDKKKLIIYILAFVACGFFLMGLFFGALSKSLDQEKTPASSAAAPKREEPKVEIKLLDRKDIELIGRTIWGEAGGVQSQAEQAAVAWCILNRVDAFDQSIEEVVTAAHQFVGYRPEGEVPKEHLELATDVLVRWYAEKDGAEDVGRVLPAEYLFFIGDGERNHFSTEWKSSAYWDWSMPDPYITT